MRKSVIIRYLHIAVFSVFVIFYFFYEEQDMLGTIMYHVDPNSNAAPFRNLFLMATTALTAVCCFWGRWPRNHFSIIVFLLYAACSVLSLLHGPAEAKGGAAYIVLFATLALPFLLYNFGYNIPFKLSQKTFERGFLIGLVILAIAYAITMKRVLISYILHPDYRDGTVYVFMMFLPLVMTFQNKKIRNIAIILISLAVMSSLKRGGFVTILIVMAVWFVTSQHVMNKKIPPIVKFLAFVLGLLVLTATVFYLNTQSEGKIFQRFMKAGADGGSGRDKVYLITFEMIANSDFSGLLLGHGWNMVRIDSPLGLSAHNDYLEVMYDVGILGLILLFLLLFMLGMKSYQLYKQKSPIAPSFIASFLIFMITSMSSHIFLYLFNMSALLLFWGYAFGLEKNQHNIQHENTSQCVSTGAVMDQK